MAALIRPYVSLMLPVLWMLLSMSVDNCIAYNLDVTLPIARSGPTDSLFGYAVALHRQSGGQNVLLVGAPTAQTSQPDVERGGAVYRCPVLADDCQQVIFDPEGQPMDDAGQQSGSKSDQFFGATLHSAGDGGPVTACAPRRVWTSENYNLDGTPRYPGGACYVADNDLTTFISVSPCERPSDDSTTFGLHEISFCQAGMSAVISMDSKLVLGAPGSYYWQGQIYDFEVANGRATQSSTTPERDATFDNYYQGYSVAQGNFSNGGVYVASEPRSDYLVGRVHIMDKDLNILQTINGEQMSAYFGFSLAVTDLNADGRDDIVVGAPMFVDPDNLLDRWEVGRAHVLLQEVAGTFHQADPVTGTFAGGQLGYSLAALGDINKDGFNDIAIGAPYAGEDGLGLVYVYHGRRRGLKVAASQIISPAILGLSIRTFGTSLSGGLDMDGNDYDDLLVGAYMSSTAVLVRTRPIIRIQRSLTFQPPQINLDTKDYQLPSGLRVSSFNVTTCLTARGDGVSSTVGVKFSLQLDDVVGTSPRVAFVQENSLENSELTRTIQLTTDQQMCLKDLVYVKIAILVKNLPIAVRLAYELATDEPSAPTGMPSAMSAVPPILSDTPMPVYVQSLPIKNTCKNYLCVPDLRLTATAPSNRVAVGDNSEVVIFVSVTNHGEDAYEASYQAVLPQGMSFIRVERIKSDLSVSCDASGDDNLVTCDIGNPFPEDYTLDFGITIRNTDLTGEDEQVVVTMEVDSKNFEPANITHDNSAAVAIEIYATAEVGLYGVSVPQQIVYTRPNISYQHPDPDTEEEAGPEVTHLYTLQNLGPSEIGRVEVQIYWPLTDLDGDYLLYLTSVKVGRDVSCAVQGGVNPDGLELVEREESRNGSDPSAGPTAGSGVKRRRRSGDAPAKAKPQVAAAGLSMECTGPSEACIVIQCIVNPTGGAPVDEDSALIEIKSRMYERTFFEKNYTRVFVSSTAFARVLEMPYMESIVPANLSTATAQATIQMIGQLLERPGTPTEILLIPFWVYILAPIGGTLILLLVSLGLWKCGFFKRKKIVPNSAAAAQENWQEEVLIEDKQ